MADKNKLFRKVALERLSSPEQLDQVLQVTTPKGWIALLALGGLIMIALIWGIYGSIPTKVNGMGIFISGDGVKDISSPTSGEVTTVYVSSGDMVQRGQIVARIAQPELIGEIARTRSRLSEFEDKKEQILTYIKTETALQTENNSREIDRISSEMSNLREQIKTLQERSNNQKRLLESGLITRRQLITTKEKIKAIELNILHLSNQKKQIPLNILQFQEEQEQRAYAITIQINDIKRKLEGEEEHLEEASKVYSHHSGRILEVPVTNGSLVSAGTRIASLELAGNNVDDLVAVFYVPAENGKQVKAGMQSHLAPTTVRAEEDGSMLGLVTSAGGFPATRAGMMRIIRNEQLVEQLSRGGSPVEIFISPIPSPKTFSGYQWTSSGGPDLKIHSGTLTTGSIIVDEQPPITLVIPWLKKNILGLGS
jgi:HlyD family secretion protein